MRKIPHALFAAATPRDPEFAHPPGAALARHLERDLTRVFETSGIDNWRDCGWQLLVAVADRPVELYFAPYGEERWLLAVAPPAGPGLIGRIFGRRSEDRSKDLRLVSEEVQSSLATFAGMGPISWMFGGPPETVQHFSHPSELPWS